MSRSRRPDKFRDFVSNLEVPSDFEMSESDTEDELSQRRNSRYSSQDELVPSTSARATAPQLDDLGDEDAMDSLEPTDDTTQNSNTSSKAGRKKICPDIDQVFSYGPMKRNRMRESTCKCGYFSATNHIQRLMAHASTCTEIDEDLRERIAEKLKRITRLGVDKSSSKTEDSKKFKDVVNELIRALSSMGLPLRFFDNENLRNALKLLNPKFRLPSRVTIAEKFIPSLARESIDRMKESLAAAKGHSLIIEFDGWEDNNRRHIVAITATTLEGKVYILKLLNETGVSQTAVRLSNIVVEVLKEYVKPAKVNAIVSDEAANYKASRELIIKKVIQYRCLAHVINLIGRRASQDGQLKTTISKANEIVNYVNNHRELRLKLSKKKDATRLFLDVPTRWYSLQMLISSLLKNRFNLEELGSKEPSLYSERCLQTVQDLRFWSSLQASSDLFEPLCNLIGYIERRDSVISDAFAILIRQCSKLLSESTSDFIDYRLAVLEAMLYHFSKLDHDLMLSCIYVDPYHRKNQLTIEAKDKATEYIITIGQNMGFNTNANLAILEDLDKFVNGVGDYQACDEDNSRCSAYQWWENQIPGSGLRAIALRLASLRPSSSNVERLFSLLGHMQAVRKSRLSLDRLEEMMRIKLDYLNTSTPKPRGLQKDYSAQVLDIVGDELVPLRVYEDELPRQTDISSSRILNSAEYLLFKRYIRPYIPDEIPLDAPVEIVQPEDSISARSLIEMYRRRA